MVTERTGRMSEYVPFALFIIGALALGGWAALLSYVQDRPPSPPAE